MKRTASPTSPLPPTETRRRQRQALVRPAPAATPATTTTATTPAVLDAIPLLVLSSGYLYGWECMVASATCTDWRRVWGEVKDTLPEQSQVEVVVASSPFSSHWSCFHPHFRQCEKPAQLARFVHRVYDKLHERQAVALGNDHDGPTDDDDEDNAGKRQKELFWDSVPQWGSDIVMVKVTWSGRLCYLSYFRMVSTWSDTPAVTRKLYMELSLARDLSLCSVIYSTRARHDFGNLSDRFLQPHDDRTPLWP